MALASLPPHDQLPRPKTLFVRVTFLGAQIPPAAESVPLMKICPIPESSRVKARWVQVLSGRACEDQTDWLTAPWMMKKAGIPDVPVPSMPDTLSLSDPLPKSNIVGQLP